jgi:hypothetical protein
MVDINQLSQSFLPGWNRRVHAAQSSSLGCGKVRILLSSTPLCAYLAGKNKRELNVFAGM